MSHHSKLASTSTKSFPLKKGGSTKGVPSKEGLVQFWLGMLLGGLVMFVLVPISKNWTKTKSDFWSNFGFRNRIYYFEQMDHDRIPNPTYVWKQKNRIWKITLEIGSSWIVNRHFQSRLLRTRLRLGLIFTFRTNCLLKKNWTYNCTSCSN